ncbi:MAG: metallophosphoesterase [Polyangia bacterium]
MAASTIILHLSDLHFSGQGGHYWNSPEECQELKLGIPIHDRRGLLGSLALDLERLEVKPDLIVVSGDLLDKASSSGVQLAQQFLNSLLERLELPQERLILVPGNHDVIRNIDKKDKYSLFEQIWNEVVGPRHGQYDGNCPPHQMARQYKIEELDLEIVGFNSCEALDEGQEHGSIGQAQRDYVERALRATKHLGLFRVAVMHHHLEKPAGVEGRKRADYSEIFDASLVREWMLDMGFRLLLHGHQHVSWERDSSISGRVLTIAASGSTGISSYGRSHWELPLSYQIIKIDNQSARPCRVYRREYLVNKLEWAAERNTAATGFDTISESLATTRKTHALENAKSEEKELASSILFDRYTPNAEPYYILRDIDQRLSRIADLKGIWLYGGAGHGKTSCLLRCIEKARYQTCYISLGNIVDGKVSSMLEQIYLDICNKYEITLKKTKGMNTNHLIRLIASSIEVVPDRNLVLYLDEIPVENTRQATDLAKSIIALVLQVAHSQDRRLKFLISSIPSPVSAIAKHQGQIYEYMYITECPSWSEDELRHLLDLATSNLAISITPDEKAKLVSYSNGSPRFVKNCLWKILLLGPSITVDKAIADVSAELRGR